MSFFLLSAKYTKRLLFSLFVFIILSLFFIGLALFTHQGNTFVFNLLQKLEPRLELTLTEGSVFYSPVYKTIHWSDGELNYQFNGVSYEFDWNCLLKEVCLESLVIESAEVNIPPTESEPVVEDKNAVPFILEFPIAVNIKHLDINNTHLKVAGIEVDLKQLLLAANGVDNDLTLNASITGLSVTLADSEAPKASLKNNKKTIAITNFPAILTDQTLPEVILPFNLIAKKLDIKDFKLIQNKKNITIVNQVNSQFTYYGSKIAINNFSVDLPEATVDLSGKVDLSKRYPMDITALVKLKKLKELQPSTLLKGQKIKLVSQGDLAGLHSTITLSNLINAKIDNNIDLYSDNLPHQLTVRWDQFNWPLSGAPQISLSKGNVSSKGDLNNYKLNIESHVAIPDLPPAEVNLKGQGNLQSLTLSQLLVTALKGNVLLKGKLNWVNNITWLGDLNINHLNFNELSETYPAQLNGHIKQSVTIPLDKTNQPAWAFNLPIIDLNGSFLERPLTVNGMANGDAINGFTVNDLSIINADNSILVNGKIAEKNDLILDLDIQDLSNIIVDSVGKIKGKVSLAGSIDKIEINTRLDATNISYLNNSVEQLSLNGDATLSDIPVADFKLDAKNMVTNNQSIDLLSILIKPDSVSTEQVKHHIDIDLKSKIISSDLQLVFAQQVDNWEAQLNQGLIESSQGLWVLNKPFSVSQQQQVINLSAHCWLATNAKNEENGKLCINKFSAGEDGDININIDNLLIATLAPFIPETLTLEGALDADINLLWKGNEKPNLDLIVDGKSIALNIKTDENQHDSIRYPVEQFHIEVQSNKQRADFSLQAISKGLINANLQGYLSPYQTTPEINSKLDLLIPNFDAFSILIPQIDKLAGQLQADINITGKLDKPTVKGQVLIADVSMKAPSSPVRISDLNAKIDIDNNQAKIDGYFFTNSKKKKKKKTNILVDSFVSLKDTAISAINIPQRIASMRNSKDSEIETNGRADINGLLDWENDLKGKIHFEADQMLIQDYGKIELYISPNINVILDKHVNVDGVIKVNKGNITVKELPEGAVSVSKDVIVVDAKQKNNSADLPIKMNLKVMLGDRLRIKAIGLDSYIHGDLIVAKELKKQLTVYGELTFSEGSYKALAQQLVLQNSRIVFQGQPDAPYLNVEAIRDPSNIEDNVTAGVRVTGTPDQLQLTIFSDPAMSQQNALSYITRGHSIANSSSDGSNSQLASILIDLGAGQTDGVMSNIGKQVGINDLSLASSGQGDQQSVGIKGTIAPGVEISYGVGVFDSFTIFAIRYELFKQFYIEASSSLYQAVDVYYEWDWD